MPITKEELVAGLDAPETATLIMSTLSERNFIVYPKDKEEEYKSNVRKTVEGDVAKDITSRMLNDFDKDISEVSGIKKKPGEKTYDYNKRAFAEILERASGNEKKILELEEKIKTGSQDQTLKAQLEALQQKQAEYEKTISEKDSILSQKEKDYAFDTSFEKALRGIKIKTDIDEDLRNTKIEVVKERRKASATFENGKIVFHNADKKPILDDKGNVATLEYILADDLKSIIDVGIKQPGAGSGNPKPGEPGKGGYVRMSHLPGDITTKTKLNEYMSAMGYIKGSKEYDEDYGKFSKGLKLQ
jgi:ribosomal protein L21